MPQRHRRDVIDKRIRRHQPGLHQLVHRQPQRHPAAGDRGAAGAAIGLDHVAIDGDLAFAQRDAIDAGAQGAADQALDFLGPARLLARRRLAPVAGVGGARQHAVFRRHPAQAGVLEERRRAGPRSRRCTAHGCRRILIRQDPSACFVTPVSIETARISLISLPDGRMESPFLNCCQIPASRPTMQARMQARLTPANGAL